MKIFGEKSPQLRKKEISEDSKNVFFILCLIALFFIKSTFFVFFVCSKIR